MQHLATLAGAGWLRTRASGASTATYEISIWRRIRGPNAGEFVGKGVLRAEITMLIEARIAGRAALILADGESIAIEITGISGNEANFTIVGAMPRF
jgi:hypothetical protein